MGITAKHVGSLRFEVETPALSFSTDVAKIYGGRGEYPSPTDLLAISLLNCILSVIGIKGNMLGLKLEGFSGSIEKKMDERGKFSAFSIIIRLEEPIEQSVADQLERVSHHCPVYEALNPNLKKEILFSWNLKSRS